MKMIPSIIDLHTHILPGLDDGSSSWDESIKMASFAQTGGTSKIFATPHYEKGVYVHTPKEIREMTQELTFRLKESGVEIQVLPGQEIHFDWALPSLFAKGQVQTLGESQFILLELPFDVFPKYTWDLLFEMSLQGASVILAHPERNLEIEEDLSLLERWIDSGGYLQVNAGSLVGAFGKRAESTAIAMARKDMIHFIGSDAHFGVGPSLSDRGPDMRPALSSLCRYSPKGKKALDEIERRSLGIINPSLT